MRSDRERLLDIVEAIGKIEQHASSDIEAFADDEMQQVWVIHNRSRLILRFDLVSTPSHKR